MPDHEGNWDNSPSQYSKKENKKANNTILYRGKHLGIIREFMLQKAINGDKLTWGSNDYVCLRPITVKELERLAEEIAQGVIEDIERLIR